MFLLTIVILVLKSFDLAETREQEIFFNEETPIGSEIFDLKSLSSNSIEYQLLEGSNYLFFNASTNVISIRKRIDRDTLCSSDESCSKCSITMKFYDMFFYEMVLLKFRINDVNDNAPIFSSSIYSFSVAEGNVPGLKILLSKGEDVDCPQNGVFFYELTYVDGGNVLISSTELDKVENDFELEFDRSKSELNLIVNRTLDREERKEFVFLITASDKVHRSTSKLILNVLDVNDNAPRFSQSVFTINVSKNVEVGTKIFHLTAIDEDSAENGRIFYSLLSVDGSKENSRIFDVDRLTGEIRLAKSFPPFESEKIFKLVVGASDDRPNSIPSLATIFIRLVDRNKFHFHFAANLFDGENFQIFLDENLPKGSLIFYGAADSKIEISSDQLDEEFSVKKLNENSLTLLVDRGFDREKRAFYDFNVSTDDEFRSFRIVVRDVNDCHPEWNISNLFIDFESTQRVFKLRATDRDQGENGRVSYRKFGASWPQWVDLVDDQIIIRCENQTESFCQKDFRENQIVFHVQAFDFGQPELSSILKITILRRPNELFLIAAGSVVAFVLVFSLVSICVLLRKRCKNRRSQPVVIVNEKTSPNLSAKSVSNRSFNGSDKSENVTLETAASYHLDNFLFSSGGTAPILDPLRKSHDCLANQLFQSIQTDLTLLTQNKPIVIHNQGTYV